MVKAADLPEGLDRRLQVLLDTTGYRHMIEADRRNAQIDHVVERELGRLGWTEARSRRIMQRG